MAVGMPVNELPKIIRNVTRLEYNQLGW